MDIERTIESVKMLKTMCKEGGKITTNVGHELFIEENEPILKHKGESYTLSSNILPLIKLVDNWKLLGYCPELKKIESKLKNGKKSECGKFTLNIDKHYVGVATQLYNGECRMVYIESIDNQENIIKDLENLFNFKFNSSEQIRTVSSDEIRKIANLYSTLTN